MVMFISKKVCYSGILQVIRSPCSEHRTAMFPQCLTVKEEPSGCKRKFTAACSTREWSINEDHNMPGYYMNEKCMEKISEKHEDKIDEVRKKLQSIINGEDESMDHLVVVDVIQRAGVSHHFQEEIKSIVQRHYEATGGCVPGLHTLHHVSLAFRLFRQHGLHVSTDVFKSFKGVDGKFKDDIIKQDMNGLIEFNEAAQLSFDGEHELKEVTGINKSLANMDYGSSMAKFRLSHPYHKSIEGLPERFFLENLLGISSWEMALRELAAMDLDRRKLAYQQDLHYISEWWNGLGLASELKLARNQPLKWYTWSMAALIDDVSLSKQRVGLTQAIAFIYLIDDIFDVYGTPDELMIFVEAVNKWDYAEIDTLPDYMKTCYKALLDTINEIAFSIYQDYGHNPIDSLKETWAILCNAFLVESKWFTSGELPTAQVYLENGIVSSGAHVVTVHLFYLLGLGGITENGAANSNEIPDKLLSSSATILRLWDDLGSAKDEHQDGKDGSYIEYYMKENEGQTIEQAQEHVRELIATAWKRLNQECFRLNDGSALPFKKACLNLARMIPLMYNYDDNQSLPVLTEYVKFMLFNK